MRNLKGQALIELLIALVAVLPLYFGVTWLARVLDMQQANIAAARQLAFECTVRPSFCTDAQSQAELAGELRRRVFSAEHFGIQSGETASGLAHPDERKTLWVDRRGDALLERFEDVSFEVSSERFNTPFAFAGGQGDRAFPGAVKTLSELAGPGRFGLTLDGGFIRAQVATQVSRSQSADGWTSRLLSMPLTLRSHLIVLTDAWNASTPYGSAPDSVQSRVEAGARVPVVEPALRAAWLPVRAVLSTAAFLGLESSARQFDPYSIDVDRVPADRLGDASSQPMTPSPLPAGLPDPTAP